MYTSTAHVQNPSLIWFLVGSVRKVIKYHNSHITTCFSFAVHIMGDVKLVTSTRVSKTSLTLSPPVPAEAPAFTLPPRNIRVQLGATARFEGKVRDTQWRASALGFALSWSSLGGCKTSEVASAIWDLYWRRIQQCLPSWGGRSITGLFLCRGEHCRGWALPSVALLSMQRTEVIISEKLLQGLCLVTMSPYCNSTYSPTAHSHPCIPNICPFTKLHVWHTSFPAVKGGICNECCDSSVSALPAIHVLNLKEKRASSEERLICSGKLVNSKDLKGCVVGCVSPIPLLFEILNCASWHNSMFLSCVSPYMYSCLF